MPPDSQQPADHDKRSRDVESWATLKRFLPYLWPKDNAPLRWRIVVAMVLVLTAKAVTLALPFAYKGAVDAMSGPGSGPGSGKTAVDEGLQVALALVAAYALGRFASVAFDNLRNIAFERVGQVATTNLAEDVFHRLHRLSLRFHLARRTGEVTKIIERGTKSIDQMLYFLLFNIAPTIIELIAVGVIFYFQFGIELVVATAVTVVLYVWVTRAITEWRTKLRREMNDLDGKALHRAVDSLLNFETVKYFNAEAREEARYAQAARCRHAALSEYFGQAYGTEPCGACDVCLDETESLPDSTVTAQKILSCVARVGERFGVRHVCEVLRGAKSEGIQRHGHDRLSTFGLLATLDQRAAENLVHQLLDQDLLSRSGGDRPVVSLNARSWEVMRGERPVVLVEPRAGTTRKAKADVDDWQGVDRDLFERLRKWRRRVADARGKPAWTILDDKSLRAIAREKPSSPAALLRCKGIGEKRLADFGAAVLDLVAGREARTE